MSSSFPETVPHGGSSGSSEPQPPDLQGSPCDLLLALPHRHPVSQCVDPLKHLLSPRSLALSPGLVCFPSAFKTFKSHSFKKKKSLPPASPLPLFLPPSGRRFLYLPSPPHPLTLLCLDLYHRRLCAFILLTAVSLLPEHKPLPPKQGDISRSPLPPCCCWHIRGSRNSYRMMNEAMTTY